MDKISDIKGVQQKIEWGSQIRSYLFAPYTLVKDTCTCRETSNVNAVIDGALELFIKSYWNCLVIGNWVQKQKADAVGQVVQNFCEIWKNTCFFCDPVIY